MAQEKSKHNSAHDSHLVVAVEDGDGHGFYVTVDPALIPDSPIMRAIAAKYELTRKGQSVAKKAARDKKDVAAALAAWAAKPEVEPSQDRVETVASFRASIARELLIAKLPSLLPTYGTMSKADQEATITANLPKFMAKRSAEVEAALQARLTAGYTPTARGTGGAKAESKGAVVLEADAF